MRGDFPDLDIPLEVLEAFPPDPSTLLELLCDRITPDMLEDLATREGYIGDSLEDSKKHLAGLQKIVRDKGVKEPLDWHPREVLELQRWGYNGGDSEPMQTAFSCACLIQEMHLSDLGLSQTATFINLARSVMCLSTDLTEPTLRFFTHEATVLDPGCDDFAVCAFALVAMLVLTDHIPDTPGMLQHLAYWLLAIDRFVLTEWVDMGDDPSPPSFAQAFRLSQPENLQELARELMPRVLSIPDLAFLARRVAGDQTWGH